MLERLTNYVRYKASKLAKPTPDFVGMYQRFDQVKDENPWDKDPWINFNRAKLDALQIGQFFTFKNGPVVDQSHILLPALILNNYAGPVRVLDFGGGTGYTYFPVSSYLNDPSRVQWSVFDSNPRLYKLGTEYAKRRNSMGFVDNIAFLDALPDSPVEVIHIASTLQYIEDCQGLLAMFALRYRPEYFLLTRTCGGPINSFVTQQTVHGSLTPCRFINIPELLANMSALGYDTLLCAPGGSFDPSQFAGIPEESQVRWGVDIVLRRAI